MSITFYSLIKTAFFTHKAQLKAASRTFSLCINVITFPNGKMTNLK